MNDSDVNYAAKNGRFARGHLESCGLAGDLMCNKHQVAKPLFL